MRKFLSILAAVGLTATTSATVVSCTKKYSQPTFHDISDVSQSFTTTNDIIKGFSVNGNLSEISQINGEDSNLELILTIAKQFKNPIDFINTMVKDGMTIAARGGYVINSDDTAVVYVQLNDNVTKQYSNVFQIRIPLNNVVNDKYQYLSKQDPVQLNTNLVKKPSYVHVLSNIVDTALSYQGTDRDNYLNAQIKGSVLGSIDNQLFIDLANKLTDASESQIYIPGFDVQKGKDYVRFDTVQQQLMMSYSNESKTEQKKDSLKDWTEVAKQFNSSIIDQLKSKFISNNTQIDPVTSINDLEQIYTEAAKTTFNQSVDLNVTFTFNAQNN